MWTRSSCSAILAKLGRAIGTHDRRRSRRPTTVRLRGGRAPAGWILSRPSYAAGPRLPGLPRARDDLVQAVLGRPAEFVVDPGGGSDQLGGVAGPALHDVGRGVQPGGLPDRLDHLTHRVTRAGPDVEHVLALLGEVVQGGEVGLGEVQDVDVVADAGAVRGGVVVAEDL